MKKYSLLYLTGIFFLALSTMVAAQSNTNSIEWNEKTVRQWYEKINQLDLEGIEQMLHDNLVFEDKTAPFNWNKEKTMNFFKKRRSMGVQNTRKLEIEDIYFINSNIVDVHGSWVGTIKGEKKQVRFSSVLILYQDKIIRWTDHYDMASFK